MTSRALRPSLRSRPGTLPELSSGSKSARRCPKPRPCRPTASNSRNPVQVFARRRADNLTFLLRVFASAPSPALTPFLMRSTHPHPTQPFACLRRRARLRSAWALGTAPPRRRGACSTPRIRAPACRSSSGTRPSRTRSSRSPTSACSAGPRPTRSPPVRSTASDRVHRVARLRCATPSCQSFFLTAPPFVFVFHFCAQRDPASPTRSPSPVRSGTMPCPKEGMSERVLACVMGSCRDSCACESGWEWGRVREYVYGVVCVVVSTFWMRVSVFEAVPSPDSSP